MDAVRGDIDRLIEKELLAANKKFALFASCHEGYAVIKEEAEELSDAALAVITIMKSVWAGIKCNVPPRELDRDVDVMRRTAVAAAIEAVQIAAMCEKWHMSEKKWDMSKKNGT